MHATEQENRSTAPLDLMASYKHIKKDRETTPVTPMEGKTGLFTFGDTGAGKSTFIATQTGKKLTRNSDGLMECSDDSIKIGDPLNSCTGAAYGVQTDQPDRLYVDSPGLRDSKGTTRDIPNVLSICAAWRALRYVSPVLLIPYHQFLNKSSMLVPLLDFYADFLGNNEKAIASTTFIVTRLQPQYSKDLVRKYFDQLSKSALSNGAFTVVCHVLDNWDKVVFHDPESAMSIRLTQRALDNAPRISTEEYPCFFALAPDQRRELRMKLEELKASVKKWAKEGDANKILQTLELLALLAPEIEMVKETLQHAKREIGEGLMADQNKATALMSAVISNPDYRPTEIEQVNRLLEIKRSLAPLEEHLPENWQSNRQFESFLVRQLTEFAESIIGAGTDFAAMARSRRKLDWLGNVLRLTTVPPAFDQIDDAITTTIGSITARLVRAPIASSHGSYEEIARDFNQFCSGVESLRLAKIHLEEFLPDYPFAADHERVLCSLLAYLQEVGESFKLNTSVETDTEELRRLWNILLVASQHTGIVDLLGREELQKLSQDVKSAVIDKFKDVLANLKQYGADGNVREQLAPIKRLSEISPEFSSQLDQPLMHLFQQLSANLTTHMDSFLQALSRSPPDGIQLVKYYESMEAARWMDEFSANLGRAAQALEKAKEATRVEISRIDRKKSRLMEAKQYDKVMECCEILSQLEEFSKKDSTLSEALDTTKAYFAQVMADLLNKISEKCAKTAAADSASLKQDSNEGASIGREISPEVYTLEEAGGVFKQLIALEPVARVLCLPVASAKEQLEALITTKAKRLAGQIDTRPNDFLSHAYVLDTLEVLNRMDWLPSSITTWYSRAQKSVNNQLEFLELDIQNAFDEGNHIDATALVEKFAQARYLIPVLPDTGDGITTRIRELQKIQISEKKEVIQRISSEYLAGRFSQLKAGLVELTEKRDKNRAFLELEGCVNKSRTELEREIGAFAPVPHSEYRFNSIAFQAIVNGLEHLERCAAIVTIDNFDYKDLSGFYQRLDARLSDAVRENTKMYRNGKLEEAQQVYSDINRAVSLWHPEKMPLTQMELEVYRKLEEDQETKITTTASFLELNKLYTRFKRTGAEELSNRTLSTVIQKAEEQRRLIKEKAATNLQEANDMLTEFNLDLEYLEARELNERVKNLAVHTGKDLEEHKNEAESRFDGALASRDFIRIKELYSTSNRLGRRSSLGFHQKVGAEQQKLETDMEAASNSRDFSKLSSLFAEYEKYREACPAVFTELEKTPVYTNLSATVKAFLEEARAYEHVNIEDQFHQGYIDCVLFLLQLYRFPVFRTILSAAALQKASAPVTDALKQIDDYLTRGQQQYDLNMLNQSLTASKSFSEVIRLFKQAKEEFTDDSLVELSRACSNVMDYAQMLKHVRLFLRSLPQKLEQDWVNNQDASSMNRALLSFMSVGFNHIKSHIDEMDEIKTEVCNKCTEIVKTLGAQCEYAKQARDHEQFNTSFHALQKLQLVEQQLGSQVNLEILSGLVAEIEQRLEDALQAQTVADIVVVLKELMNIADERPAMEKHAQNAIQALLERKIDLIESIEAQLRDDEDRLAQLLIKQCPQFSRLRVDLWIKKTQGVTPTDAIAALRSSGIQKDPSFWRKPLKAILNILGRPQQDKMLRAYLSFADLFKQFIEKHKISPDWVAIREEAVKHCQLLREDNLPQVLAIVLGVWSLLKSNNDFNSLNGNNLAGWYQPHVVQFVVLYDMLSKDDRRQFINQLSQINTGEGKSVILGTLSTIFALCGYDVKCICYSSYLSGRDAADFAGVFEKFNVQDHIEYSNIEDMCRNLIHEDGDIKQLVDQYLDGTIGSSPPVARHPRKRVLLIDEVDVFFGVHFYGNTFNPATRIQNEHTYQILSFIWKNKNATLGEVSNLTAYQELVEQFGQENLIRGEISKMLQDVHDWKRENPMPVSDKIAYAINGNTSFSTAFGYCTAFAYFHFYDKGDITLDSLKENTGIHVVYGIFSYAEIPRQFDVVMGVSGTLTKLSNAEKAILSSYKIRKINISASMYGKPNLSFAPAADIRVYSDEKEWRRKITAAAKLKLTTRAVIVIFRSSELMKEYIDEQRSSFDANLFQVLDETSEFKSNIIQRASKAQMMTVIARPFGRGSDFACQDEQTRSEGGVHVIQTFVADSAAEEAQIRGRTARQGDRGSLEMILWQEDLINAGLSEEQINNDLDNRQLYQSLAEIRDNAHLATMDSLREAEYRARNTHQETMELRSLLLDWSPEKKAKVQRLIWSFNGFRQLILPFFFFFVLDDSGSMRGRWKYVVAALEAFIQRRIDMCHKADCTPDDRATIINYSHTAHLVCANEKLDLSLAQRTNHRGGDTDFKVGLEMAYEQMSLVNKETHHPVLVFMSDGGSVTGDPEINMIATDFAPSVFILGFGKNCDKNKLTRMARLSGGEYYEGVHGAELKSVFEEVSTKVSSVSF